MEKYIVVATKANNKSRYLPILIGRGAGKQTVRYSPKSNLSEEMVWISLPFEI